MRCLILNFVIMRKSLQGLLCVIALLASVAALVVSLLRNSTSDVDYPSLLVSVLSVLVTALIGWNIYTIFDFNSRKKDMDAKLLLISKQCQLMEEQAQRNRGLLEQSISDLYYHLLGVKHPIHTVYFYLSHIAQAITAFAHIGEYELCEVLIKTSKEVVARPEAVAVNEKQKKQLLTLLLCVQDTRQLPSFPDLLSLVSRLGNDTH